MVAVHAFGTFIEEAGIPVRFEEPLASYTTFKVGGPAEFFIEPRDTADLAGVFRAARECSVPVRVLGGGSNVLVRDEGVRGAVVRLSRFQSRRGMNVQAGYSLTRLVKETVAEGLAGLDGIGGVPGTVGGAVAMNVGGRNGEFGAAVRWVEVMGPDGEVLRLSRAEAGFRYRGSDLGDRIVLSVELDLAPGEGVRERYEAVMEEKKAAQPLGVPSAGCVFKNPAGTSAGRVVDGCGLKGTRVGGACVSPKHGNFIVNEGGATAADILKLIDLIRSRVPVSLELEVKVW